jgi:hypothetical protein
MMPSRIIPDIIFQHLFNEFNFAIPQSIIIEVGKEPLSVRPGVIILLVFLQRSCDELELWCRFPRFSEEESAMMPDLVRLKILDGQFVHEMELDVQRGFDSQEGLISILPASHTIQFANPTDKQNGLLTMQYNEQGSVE